MTMTNARELDLAALHLKRGAHDPDGEFCVMEAVAYIAGEAWTDAPECASPVIGAMMRQWNDDMNDEDRQILVPLIPRLVGTAAGPAIEERRSWLALDWLCRVHAPRWLRAAGLEDEAQRLETAPPVLDAATARAVRALAAAAGAAAVAAGAAAAWAAAGAAGAAGAAAAREAAWAAEAAVAAGAAAAREAAWASAAWAAEAAGAAAGAAAAGAAEAGLRPVVKELQGSALGLVDRMIECGS